MNVKHEELTVRALYDLSYTAARPLLEACTYPWDCLLYTSDAADD